jgi:hypothetical protein
MRLEPHRSCDTPVTRDIRILKNSGSVCKLGRFAHQGLGQPVSTLHQGSHTSACAEDHNHLLCGVILVSEQLEAGKL